MMSLVSSVKVMQKYYGTRSKQDDKDKSHRFRDVSEIAGHE